MANKRKPLSKKIRFEVFKRDKFTCQYCGRSAPDVVLEVDHIKPVAEGGDNNIINLVTSCFECNRGKGKRELADDSAVKKQIGQLRELQERREQLDMMMQWREELNGLRDDGVSIVVDAFKDHTGYSITENGKKNIKKWLRQFSLREVLDALDVALEHYFDNSEGEVEDAAEAFSKTPGICRLSQLEQSDSYDYRFYYTNYIAKAFRNSDWPCDKQYIKQFVFNNIDSAEEFDVVKSILNKCSNHYSFWENIEKRYGDDWRYM